MGEDKKNNLIQAAFKLFEEQGYRTTKVSDIVREAGVAQGTFYLYFKSKEDLFRNLAERCLEQITAALQTDSAFTGTDAEQYYKIIHRALEVYYEHKSILKIIKFHGLGSQEIASVSEIFYQQMVVVIKQALCSVALYTHYTEQQLEIMAFAKIGMVELVAYQWFVVQGYGRETIEEVAQIIVGASSPCKFESME